MICGLLAQSNSARAQTEPQNQRALYRLPFEVPVVRTEEPDDIKARESSARRAEQREIDNLAAVNRATAAAVDTANYSLIQMIVSMAGLIFLIGTVYLTYRANATALRGVRDARELGEAQLAPYVSINSASVHYEGDGLVMAIGKAYTTTRKDRAWVHLDLVNHGETPAPLFTVNYGAVLRPQIVGLEPSEARELFTKDRSWSHLTKAGLPLELTPRDMKAITRELMMSPSDRTLFVYGRIMYHTLFNRAFETEFLFYARKSDCIFAKRTIKLHRSTGHLRSYHPVTQQERKTDWLKRVICAIRDAGS